MPWDVAQPQGVRVSATCQGSSAEENNPRNRSDLFHGIPMKPERLGPVVPRKACLEKELIQEAGGLRESVPYLWEKGGLMRRIFKEKAVQPRP